jgi:predicted adenylyl cyclase CyaB
MSPEPRRNIELKARLRDPAAAAAIAQRLTGGTGELQTQTDTYFHCRDGRLKTRRIENGPGQLIWYARPDRAESRASDYRLIDLPDAAAVEAALAAALGVRSVVRKRRRIYLHQNVRIHLDEVAGAGNFLEFEAVISSAEEEAAAPNLLAELSRRFGLLPADLLSGSYGDLPGAAEPDRRNSAD